MQDEIIIEKLFERNEAGLTLLDETYRSLAFTVMAGVLGNAADCEECYNDLLLAVWNSIPPNRPRSLEAYLCALARRVAITRYRYNTRDRRNAPYTVTLSELEDVIPDTPEPASEDRAVTEALNRFLEGLDPETRVLFLRRYVAGETAEALAKRFGMTENAVASRLYRARGKLRKQLRKENIRI